MSPKTKDFVLQWILIAISAIALVVSWMYILDVVGGAY